MPNTPQPHPPRDDLYRDARVSATILHERPQPFYVVEPVNQAARGTILFIHGLSEHALRFLRWSRTLAEQGYRCVTFHLAGHGTTPEEIGRVNWLAEAYLSLPTEDLLDRIARAHGSERAFLHENRRANTRRMAVTKMHHHIAQACHIARTLHRIYNDETLGAFYLGGHSLGGLLAAETGWELWRQGPIKPRGVMLFSPAMRAVAPPQHGRIGRTLVDLSWATRRHTLLAPLGWILHAPMAMNFRLRTGWAHQYVSDIEAEQMLHARDPLILDRITAGYLNRIEGQMARTMRHASSYPCHVIAFCCSEDPVVLTRGTEQFMAQASNSRANPQIACHVYPNHYAHSPLHASIHDDVMRKLTEWLSRH